MRVGAPVRGRGRMWEWLIRDQTDDLACFFCTNDISLSRSLFVLHICILCFSKPHSFVSIVTLLFTDYLIMRTQQSMDNYYLHILLHIVFEMYIVVFFLPTSAHRRIARMPDSIP